MMLKDRLSAVGISLALIHFVIAVWAACLHYEGSWGYVPFALPDLPVSLLAIALSLVFDLPTGWPLIIIFGSLWWYFLGWGIQKLFARRLEMRMVDEGDEEEGKSGKS